VFVIEMWNPVQSESITTPLVTLAGTGIGFIGGMVAEQRRSGSEDDRNQEKGGND